MHATALSQLFARINSAVLYFTAIVQIIRLSGEQDVINKYEIDNTFNNSSIQILDLVLKFTIVTE